MFVTITLIPIFKSLAVRVALVDMPDQRKVHTTPMPKIGGLAMAMGILPTNNARTTARMGAMMVNIELLPAVLMIFSAASFVFLLFSISFNLDTSHEHTDRFNIKFITIERAHYLSLIDHTNNIT